MHEDIYDLDTLTKTHLIVETLRIQQALLEKLIPPDLNDDLSHSAALIQQLDKVFAIMATPKQAEHIRELHERLKTE
ncbi:hypothetical protein [Pseudomonas sp. 250J]|uniref:hypothetical protein n=1 Tax=Pseudomonas sp. 250J TaxID=1478142 RepID=UPI000A5B31B2|nr:hypothetical protein [Pseudomonas sp. 250J]